MDVLDHWHARFKVARVYANLWRCNQERVGTARKFWKPSKPYCSLIINRNAWFSQYWNAICEGEVALRRGHQGLATAKSFHVRVHACTSPYTFNSLSSHRSLSIRNDPASNLAETMSNISARKADRIVWRRCVWVLRDGAQ